MSRASKKLLKIILIVVIVVIVLGGVTASFVYFRAEDGPVLPLGLLSDNLPLVKLTPALLGYPEAKTYLFILQNSDEMRPTGGFIGTYGSVTVESGRITNFFTDDVYNLDKLAPADSRPSAPEPIQEYLEQPKFYLRDANWFPDFPASANQILQFYKEEIEFQPDAPSFGQIDGVIAIMPETIKRFLELTGPITVQDQTFSADNLTDALEYSVEIGFEHRGIVRPQRKSIISDLGAELIKRAMQLPRDQWPDVLQIINSSLDEKHFIVFFTDEDTQKKVSAYNWAGEIKSAPLDYLAVFDANMFSMKTDPYVSRNISYKTYQRGEALIGETEIIYSYPKAGPAWKTKGYRSWTRVYVPKGSVLQKVSGVKEEELSSEPGSVVVSQEFDKTVFGAFVAVQVGETKRIKFTYRLPEYIAEAVDDEYELMVQKQPGTLGHNLTISADFDKVPRSWEPTGLSAKRDNTQLNWQTSLQKDQTFKIEF